MPPPLLSRPSLKEKDLVTRKLYLILFLRPKGYQYCLRPVERDSQIFISGNLYLVAL